MHSQNERLLFYPNEFWKRKGQYIQCIVYCFVFYDNSWGHSFKSKSKFK